MHDAILYKPFIQSEHKEIFSFFCKNMNRLSFADFHAKHFGQEQQEYWKSFLQQQQFYSYQNTDEKLPHNTNLNPNDQSYEAFEDQNYNEDYPQEDQMEEEDDECHGLSKEAIEIFKFSEAYKKERQYKVNKFKTYGY